MKGKIGNRGKDCCLDIVVAYRGRLSGILKRKKGKVEGEIIPVKDYKERRK